MTRVHFFLYLSIMASAFALVHTQYESRHLFVELDRAKAKMRQLQIENQQLFIEKEKQGTPQRVQELAKQKLQMQLPSPATTVYVSEAHLPKSVKPSSTAEVEP